MTDRSEHPLITFALFAYNQEKYVREAVEGAFSQTYEPLEIILSDDCSSDRTFEIMQEMAAAYKGSHQVQVRRTQANQGIIDHVLGVSHEASGSLMVVAAGDDVSYPERCDEIVDEWLITRAVAVYSGCADISDDGTIVRDQIFPEPLPRVQTLFKGCLAPKRYEGKVRNIPGYSAAYLLSFMKMFPKTGLGIHNEDALTTYVANLSGGSIGYVKKVLLKRRISHTSISARSVFSTISEVRNNEVVIQNFSKSSLGFLNYFSGLGHLCDPIDFSVVLARLYDEREYLEVVSNFWNRRVTERLHMLLKVRSTRSAKYMLPRMFGLNVFCSFKLFFQNGKSKG